MNKWMIATATGIVGLVAGGVGGYFVAKKKIHREYEDFLDIQIAATQAHYKQTIDTLREELRDALNRAESLKSELSATLTDSSLGVPQKVSKRELEGIPPVPRPLEKGKTDYTSYHKIVDPGLGEEIYEKYKNLIVPESSLTDPPPEDEPEDDEESDRAKPKDQQRLKDLINQLDSKMDLGLAKQIQEIERHNAFGDRPYVITREEFEELEEEGIFMTEFVTRYMVDDVYANEQDEMMLDYMDILGPDIDTAWLQKPMPELVHIRNDKLGILYEVGLHGGGYKQHVAGLYDDDETTLEDLHELHERRIPDILAQAQAKREEAEQNDPIDGDNDDLDISLEERMNGGGGSKASTDENVPLTREELRRQLQGG